VPRHVELGQRPKIGRAHEPPGIPAPLEMCERLADVRRLVTLLDLDEDRRPGAADRLVGALEDRQLVALDVDLQQRNPPGFPGQRRVEPVEPDVHGIEPQGRVVAMLAEAAHRVDAHALRAGPEEGRRSRTVGEPDGVQRDVRRVAPDGREGAPALRVGLERVDVAGGSDEARHPVGENPPVGTDVDRDVTRTEDGVQEGERGLRSAGLQAPEQADRRPRHEPKRKGGRGGPGRRDEAFGQARPLRLRAGHRSSRKNRTCRKGSAGTFSR
jgi:hypothetical protein